MHNLCSIEYFVDQKNINCGKSIQCQECNDNESYESVYYVYHEIWNEAFILTLIANLGKIIHKYFRDIFSGFNSGKISSREPDRITGNSSRHRPRHVLLNAFFGWVFQRYGPCHAPKFSKWRLDEFSSKTVYFMPRKLANTG